MCTLVFTDSDEIRTVAELAKLLGARNIVALGMLPLEDANCLCWVDVPASAEKAGWLAEDDEFGYRLKKDDTQ